MNPATTSAPAAAAAPERRPGVWPEALVLLAYAALFLLAVGAPLRAPLSFIEEHRLLEDAQAGPRAWGRVLLDDSRVIGRVRPMFFAWHFGRVALFGDWAGAQRALVLSVGVLTAWLLFLALRRAGADLLAAALFPPLVLFSGSQGDVWYLLMSAAETPATALLAYALLSLVRAARAARPGPQDVRWLAAATAAGLAKESFILVLPALLLLRLGLEALWQQRRLAATLRRHRALVVATGALTLLMLGAIAALLALRPAGHGAQTAGFGSRSFSPAVWWGLLQSADVRPVARHASAALALLAAWWAVARRRRGAAAWVGLAVATLAAWCLPQLVLHAGSGLAQRYVLPLLLLPAAFYMALLAALRRLGRVWSRLVWATGLAWAAVSIAVGVSVTFQRSTWWAAEARSSGAAVRLLADNVEHQRLIVVLGDPATGWGFEAVASLPTYLRQAGWQGPILLAPVQAPLAEQSPPNAALAPRAIERLSVYTHGELGRIDAAFVANERAASAGLLRLMDLAGWRELGVGEPFYALQARPPFVRRAGVFTRRVLLRGHPAAQFPARHPLLQIAPELASQVGVNPLVATPYGLEAINGQTMAWLGHAEGGALEGVLWSQSALDVRLELALAAGPARADARRSVRVTLGAPGETPEPATLSFERGEWLRLDARLAAGPNRLRVEVADRADATRPPDGDPRVLLVLVQALKVVPKPRNSDAMSSSADRRRSRAAPPGPAASPGARGGDSRGVPAEADRPVRGPR